MTKKLINIAFISFFIANSFSQTKIKVDGVGAVIGKNIVLDSDIDKFKKELNQRSEGKLAFTDCKILEEIMLQKLLAHQAVIDSVEVSDSEINQEVERTINYFTQQLGGEDKVIEFYGFNNIEELRNELREIQKEQLLIKNKRFSIINQIDVSPEEVYTYFNSLKEKDELPEFGTEIELAQIVIYAEPSLEETNRVINKLNEIKSEIEQGASFKIKAILNSDDPAVTQNSGKYIITRDAPFIKEFKEAAFSLDQGAISEPFKSQFGFHIVYVEKIKGQEREVSHILIQPNIDDHILKEKHQTLLDIKDDIKEGRITFEQAVNQFSQDNATKFNKGLLINPYTNDTHFELTRMDPSLYGQIAHLNQGEITEPFYDETREGEKMFKIILLKTKQEEHTADYVKDYVKIKNLAKEKKQDEALDKWSREKIQDTYIKISNNFKECEFKNDWFKNNN